MRRGLLSWSETEVPPAVLEDRLARLRGHMAGEGLDALLVYTNFPRPAAVSYLTHFVPYWSQGMLIVPPEGAPVLAVSLSKRVSNWIRETAHVSEIINTPNLGRELAARLKSGGHIRVGAVELNRLPGAVINALEAEYPDIELTDSTALYQDFRATADETEIALSRRAAEIARTALALARPGDAAVQADILSAIERSARMAGCEEILIDVAEDLAADGRFRRLDGPTAFKDRYAVRLSVAYKGHWVRLARSFDQRWPEDRANELEAHIVSAAGSADASGLPGFSTGPIGLEACIGTLPLQSIVKPAAGQIVSVNRTWHDEGGAWLASDPVLAGPDGNTSGSVALLI